MCTIRVAITWVAQHRGPFPHTQFEGVRTYPVLTNFFTWDLPSFSSLRK